MSDPMDIDSNDLRRGIETFLNRDRPMQVDPSYGSNQFLTTPIQIDQSHDFNQFLATPIPVRPDWSPNNWRQYAAGLPTQLGTPTRNPLIVTPGAPERPFPVPPQAPRPRNARLNMLSGGGAFLDPSSGGGVSLTLPTTQAPALDSAELVSLRSQWRAFHAKVRALNATVAQLDTISAFLLRAEAVYAETGIAIPPPSPTRLPIDPDPATNWVKQGNLVIERGEDAAFKQTWDAYLAAERVKGPQFEIAAEMEQSWAQDHRDNGEPFRYPPRGATDPVARSVRLESYQIEDDYFSIAQRLGFGLDLGVDLDGVSAGTWTLQATLGSGGQGHAGLWVRLDEHGQIVDRVAVKENYKEKSSWNGRMWMPATLVDPLLPREVYIHRGLSSLPGSDDIVRFRSFAIYERLWMYRIYMEYCDIKDDLGAVMKNHAGTQWGWALWESDEDMGTHDNQPFDRQVLQTDPIPEPAIWAVFEALADSLHLMKTGQPPGPISTAPDWNPPVPTPCWREIIHMDIKPNNVFLSKPDPAAIFWPATPKFKLGDFGLSRMAETDPNIPARLFRGAGTQGLMAPEQVVNTHPSLEDVHMSSATNVWAVGATIANLIRLDPTTLVFTNQMPAIGPRERSIYTHTLVSLVERCCAYQPQDRILVEDLCEEIETEVAAVGSILGSIRGAGLKDTAQTGLLRYAGNAVYDQLAQVQS